MTDDLDLWQFLERREEEIIRKRKALSDELEALREARASLENRRRHPPRSAIIQEKLTIKEMVRNVLSRNPEGGTSDQIANWINEIHGVEVARTSLSPQLSRLKADDQITLHDETGVWQLVGSPHGRKLSLSERARLSRHHQEHFEAHMEPKRRTDD